MRTIRRAGAMLAGAGLAFTVMKSFRACAIRPDRLRGKVVVITGGSRGLGLALAEELGRAGAKLVLVARNGEELERAHELLLNRHCVQRSEDIILFTADLHRAEDADRSIAEATRRFGRVDILINNAGIIGVGSIETQTLEDFREVMDANFFSGLHCTLAVLPQMLARRSGAIVNVTSIGGKVAVPHMLPYVASKFAAVGLSEGLTAELRGKGIQVTTVCPGLMRTGSHLNAYFKGNAACEYSWFSAGAGLPGIVHICAICRSQDCACDKAWYSRDRNYAARVICSASGQSDTCSYVLSAAGSQFRYALQSVRRKGEIPRSRSKRVRGQALNSLGQCCCTSI